METGKGEQMKKAIKAIIIVLFFLFDIWVLCSIVDIAAHNLNENPQYSEANFFIILTKGEN